MMTPPGPESLSLCRCCGLVLRLVPVAAGQRLRCPRCHAGLRSGAAARSVSRAAAFSLAALILYPLAMALPVLEVEQLGRRNEATIWSGVVTLFQDGHAALALVVLTCSVVVPLLKIGGMLAVSLRFGALSRRHRAITYRAIDWIGRWGMVDVLLVALLVAAVKLGDWVDVHAGPGALAFAGVVAMSMLASASFDPGAIWEERA